MRAKDQLNVPGSGPGQGQASFFLFDRARTPVVTVVPLPNGTTSDWYRLRLTMDFTANGGDGSMSMFEQNLTLGEVSFTPITEMQNLSMGILAGGSALQPVNWTHDWIRVDSSGSLDNLSFNSTPLAETPEPGICALILAGSLSGTMLLRLRSSRRKLSARNIAARSLEL